MEGLHRLKHVHRERRQPMLAAIVTRRDVRETFAGVMLGGGDEGGAVRIVHGEGGGDAIHAPGAAEIESVEVDELQVASVGDNGGGEQSRWEFGEEAMEPVREIVGRQDARHQVRFDQRRGEEVRAARFVRGGDVFVAGEVVETTAHEQGLEFGVTDGAGVVEREGETEGSVSVCADADGVSLFRKKIKIAVNDHVHQRTEVARPIRRVGVGRGGEFVGQFEEPRPAVGALEGTAVRREEIVGFGLEIGLGEVARQRGADLVRLWEFGEETQEARQHPMAVDGGVPVETAVEGGMQRARRLNVHGTVEDEAWRVGVFAGDAREGEVREEGGVGEGEGGHGGDYNAGSDERICLCVELAWR